MNTLAELAARLDRLESRNAITELATRYAIACDEQDLDALVALFTEDAVMDSTSGRMRAVGRAGIRALFTRTLATRGPSCHWTHDVLVRPDASDSDQASGIVYSHAETTPDGVPSVAAFRYADRYRREQGVWRFSRREIAYLYYVPAADYPSALGSPLRVAAGDGRVAADYPETLPSWQAFRANPGGA
jgi:uncharacterized protein (TIGR02246 family)